MRACVTVPVWFVIVTVIAGLVTSDYLFSARRTHTPTLREAAVLSASCLAIAIVFGIGVCISAAALIKVFDWAFCLFAIFANHDNQPREICAIEEPQPRLDAEAATDDFLHDFGRAAVDRLHPRIEIGPRNWVFAHVAVATV